MLADVDRGLRPRDHRALAAAARHGAARPRAVPLVGLCGAGLRRGRAAGSTSCAQEGKIDLIGGTNFDTPHTEALVAAGVPLASMQVQYSLLDARPENGLVDACRRARRPAPLLRHGGGRLPERRAGSAQPEPQPPFENRSLTKYKLIIDDFGGWALFQELLAALRADRRPPRRRHRHGREPLRCSTGRWSRR